APHAPADPPLRPAGRAIRRRAGHLGNRRLREDTATSGTRGPPVVRGTALGPEGERIGPPGDPPLGPEVDGIPRQRSEPNNIIVRPHAEPGRMVLVLIGLMVSGLGLLLVFGDRSGLAPTVPYLGFAVMVVGGVIIAAGRS